MPQCCAVPFCSATKGGHKFPKEEPRLSQWLRAIRREHYKPSRHALVCKKHFTPDDYMLPKESTMEIPKLFLRPTAVPSQFVWNQKSKVRKGMESRCAERALEHLKIIEVSTLQSHTMQNQNQNTFEEKSEDNYYEIEIEPLNKDVSVQTTLCQCGVNNSNNPATSRQRTLNMFQIEDLKEKPDVVQFYSGFNSYYHFMFVFNLFGEEVNNLKYFPSLQLPQGNHTLTPCNQFYLTLVKLRRNMCYKELSFHFEIDKTTASNYFLTWINYLYDKFQDLKVWVPTATSDEDVMFQRKTSKVIIVSQQAQCSNYESDRLKILVGISSSGQVTFVSDAYSETISDSELFEQCGINNQIQEGDNILGDQGFKMQDLVSHMNVTENMPQFVKKENDQFEADRLIKSEIFPSEHINVERVIGLDKIFKILSNKLLVPLRGKIIFVCFILAIFRSNKINVNKPSL